MFVKCAISDTTVATAATAFALWGGRLRTELNLISPGCCRGCWSCFNCVNAYATADIGRLLWPIFSLYFLILFICLCVFQVRRREEGGVNRMCGQATKPVHSDRQHSLQTSSKSCRVFVIRVYSSRINLRGVALVACDLMCQTAADVLMWQRCNTAPLWWMRNICKVICFPCLIQPFSAKCQCC